MGVTDGQAVSAAVTNPAFIDANNDDTAFGKYTLANVEAASGANVVNLQREANSLNAFTGRPAASAHDATPVWVNNDVGASTDDLHDRAEELTAKFNDTTGHKHTGDPGDAPPIDAVDLADVRLRGYVIQGATLVATTGTSRNVSTELTGKTASTGDTVKGVVVTGPNRVILRDATAATEDGQLRDADGDIVYARLTEAASVWTLSFYANKSGVETAHNFTGATDLKWYYQELFNPITDAPVYSEFAAIPSDNATQDVIDATATKRGLVSAMAQTLGGDKTFQDDVTLQSNIATEREDTASAASIAQLSSAKSFAKITGATATTIHGIAAGRNGQIIAVHNGSSAVLTIAHQSGTAVAADRLKLPSGIDMEIGTDSSASFIYDSVQSRWVIHSGSGTGGGGAYQPTGTIGAPTQITAAGGIGSVGTDQRSLFFIEGDTGHEEISANPQIADGSIIGQELLLYGTNDDATVTLNDGNGLKMNGPWIGGAHSMIEFLWNGTDWAEKPRR